MSFLDWVTGKITCPRCGTSGAKEINGAICCPNPTCAYFSKTMGKSDAGAPTASITLSQRAETDAVSGPVPAGSFAIRYRNFRGQEKSFVAEAASACRLKNHINVKVAPQGVRIMLARERILNLSEVEAAFPQRVAPGQEWPSASERRVLNYHKARGSTSPCYQKVRAKYPDW